MSKVYREVEKKGNYAFGKNLVQGKVKVLLYGVLIEKLSLCVTRQVTRMLQRMLGFYRAVWVLGGFFFFKGYLFA